MKVKVLRKSHHPLPKYQTLDSAGADLYANIEEPVTLKPLERTLIPTGLYLEFPRGYEAQIRPRSGLSIRHGITLINSIGTIDSDYRGELLIPVVNLSNETYTITDGERIAQIVFSPVIQAVFEETDSLSQTQRGEGGFGSTGKEG